MPCQEITRKCGLCFEIKPISEFSKAQKRNNGKGARCKRCVLNYRLNDLSLVFIGEEDDYLNHN